jgi:hypothetical protein
MFWSMNVRVDEYSPYVHVNKFSPYVPSRSKNFRSTNLGVGENTKHRFSTKKMLCISSCKLLPGLPDGIFSNQNTNLGKFWSVLQWKMLVYFMAIWYILRNLRSLAYFVEFKIISIFFPFWYVVHTEKNLATLVIAAIRRLS